MHLNEPYKKRDRRDDDPKSAALEAFFKREPRDSRKVVYSKVPPYFLPIGPHIHRVFLGRMLLLALRNRLRTLFGHQPVPSRPSQEVDDHLPLSTRVPQTISMTDRKNIDFESLPDRPRSRYRSKRLIFAAIVVAGIFALIIAGALINRAGIRILANDEEHLGALVPPDPEVPQPPTWSKMRTFKRGAVCADGAPCAQIGKMMLDQNGSAVDAAIAAMICNGLVTMQSMGIGGGFMMTLYERSTGETFFLNAREVAPMHATYDMYENKSSSAPQIGPLAMGVPGEVAGYWAAHQRFGKLPWAELFRPNIEMCRNGFNMTKPLYDVLLMNPPDVRTDPTLVGLFVDPETNAFRPPGSTIRPLKLCDTLELIAEKNASIFYNGTVGEKMIEDLKKRGSILTMKDLNDYRVKWSKPVESDLSEGNRLITAGLPSSGPLLAFILNVLQDFNFSAQSLADLNSTITTYHRIIETFKYAYAMRTHLGDGDFVDLSDLLKNLTSKDYARLVHDQISDVRTWNDPQHYGATGPGPESHGTAHIAALAPNGDAVSVTSSINFYFGSGIVSESTGILLNGAMDDFGVPSVVNYFGVPPGKNNYIVPGKRALSSMAPSIIVGSDGDVRMVVGAAGGTRITTSISYVIARHLWMKNTIKEALDASRVHHQTFPMQIAYEYGVPRPIVEGLVKLGHKVARYRDRGSVVCAIVQINGTIYANADFRKVGDVYGVD